MLDIGDGAAEMLGDLLRRRSAAGHSLRLDQLVEAPWRRIVALETDAVGLAPIATALRIRRVGIRRRELQRRAFM